MNREKWSDPRVSPQRLVVKLMEETGEVAKAFGDYTERHTPVDRSHALSAVISECDHVIFIAEQLKEASVATLATGVGHGHG